MIRRITRSPGLVVVGCLLILAAPAFARDPGPQLRVDLEITGAETGNLFYQLECLAERVRCSYAAYHEFWQSLGFGEGDRAVLGRFAETLDLYNSRAELGKRASSVERTSPFGPEVTDLGPAAWQSIALLSRIRIAAYGAPDRKILRDRLRLLMHSRDVDTVIAAIDHFQPRFAQWWRQGMPGFVDHFAADLAVLLSEDLSGFLSSVAVFYGLDDSDEPIDLYAHLMPHPVPAEQTRGTALENHAVIEVRWEEAPAERIGVLVHEFAHHFLASASPEFHARRLQGALRTGDPRSPAALGLMNEALATAIGNGALEARLRADDFEAYADRPLSFYGTSDIDTAAKAILPLVTEYLDNNRALDDAFVDEYFSLVIDALGEELDSLEARLRVSGFVAGNSALNDAMQQATGRLNTRSVWHANLDHDSVSDAVLTRHTYLNGVVLSRSADLGRFAGLLSPDIPRTVAASGDELACVTPRESGAVLYVLVTEHVELSGEEVVTMLRSASPCARDDSR